MPRLLRTHSVSGPRTLRIAHEGPAAMATVDAPRMLSGRQPIRQQSARRVHGPSARRLFRSAVVLVVVGALAAFGAGLVTPDVRTAAASQVEADLVLGYRGNAEPIPLGDHRIGFGEVRIGTVDALTIRVQVAGSDSQPLDLVEVQASEPFFAESACSSVSTSSSCVVVVTAAPGGVGETAGFLIVRFEGVEPILVPIAVSGVE